MKNQTTVKTLPGIILGILRHIMGSRNTVPGRKWKIPPREI